MWGGVGEGGGVLRTLLLKHMVYLRGKVVLRILTLRGCVRIKQREKERGRRGTDGVARNLFRHSR